MFGRWPLPCLSAFAGNCFHIYPAKHLPSPPPPPAKKIFSSLCTPQTLQIVLWALCCIQLTAADTLFSFKMCLFMMWYIFCLFCISFLSLPLQPRSCHGFHCFSANFVHLLIGDSRNHTITLFYCSVLSLIFPPMSRNAKSKSLIYPIYLVSAQVTKKVPVQKESRGGSAWSLLLFKHSKAFYKLLSLFFFFTNQCRVANCAE